MLKLLCRDGKFSMQYCFVLKSFHVQYYVKFFFLMLCRNVHICHIKHKCNILFINSITYIYVWCVCMSGEKTIWLLKSKSRQSRNSLDIVHRKPLLFLIKSADVMLWSEINWIHCVCHIKNTLHSLTEKYHGITTL